MVDLALAGYAFASLSDLRHSGVRYRKAIPILLSWLPKVTEVSAKEEIVRALSVPWAKPLATRSLIVEFRSLSQSEDPTGLGLRWTIGNAIWVVADDSVFEETADLVRDRRFGRAREMIVLGLGKSKRPEAVDLLISLVDDPDVDGHAVKALGELKVERARTALESKLDDPRTWVRREAQKALAKLPI